jgi:hypothetical protein
MDAGKVDNAAGTFKYQGNIQKTKARDDMSLKYYSGYSGLK